MYGQQPTWSSQPQQQQPYGGYGGYPPPPPVEVEEKGTALKVFGILGASFGGLNLLYNAYSILQAVLQMRSFERTPMPTMPGGAGLDMAGFMNANLQITVAHGIAMIIMDIALIAIGVLLIQRREIGRKLAIAWAGLALIVLIGRGVSTELWLMPYIDNFLDSMSKGTSGKDDALFNGGLFSAFARVALYLGLAVLAVWPIVLLVAMNLQSVKRGIARKIIRQAGWAAQP